MKIECPEKLLPIYETQKRFIAIYGGRGSAKSWGVSDFLLAKGIERQIRILCAREVQNSIKDSVHKLLSDRIVHHGLTSYYRITDDKIIGLNGTEFIFKGLHRNPQDVKSTEGIDYCWIEEAHTVSQESLDVLVPTVRKPGSQIIFTFNPNYDDDPVYVDYVKTERDNCLKIQMNYTDNPWFPEVLQKSMEYDREHFPNKYLHVWKGMCVIESDEIIGAFEAVDVWDCQYCVAFTDPSFSDKTGTDSTAVSVVGVTRDGKILFTGLKLPKSISDEQTRHDIVSFLQLFTPIESVIESQLSDTAIFFIDKFKETERPFPIKNLWTTKHQHKNKHERIAATVIAYKPEMRILSGTQQEYSLEVSRYFKGTKRGDDCPDSLAGALEHLATSPIVAEYAAAVEVLRR
jgi:PBSX family phage terminase large subunit